MFISDPIFKRGTDGKIRQWNYIVEDDKWATLSGIMGGDPTQSKWTVAKPKNVGKSNATTGPEQAHAEGKAKREEKLRSDYRANVADVDTVPKGPMLAVTYAGNLDFSKGVWSQPKLDGIRALITRDSAMTRNLQQHTNVDHIMAALDEVLGAGIVTFDGELYNHEHKANFNKLIRMVRKVTPDASLKHEIETTLQYHIYDVVKSDNTLFSVRSDRLTFLRERFHDHPIIKIVPTHRVSDQGVLDTLNAGYIAQGYEGQMVRLDTPYEWDIRSKGLQKRKEFITEEFPLLDIQEGEGNWSGCAKRIVLSLPDGTTNDAGMRGDQEFARELLDKWRNQLNTRPTQVTIRYFGKTPDGKLRFPVATDFHNGRVD